MGRGEGAGGALLPSLPSRVVSPSPGEVGRAGGRPAGASGQLSPRPLPTLHPDSCTSPTPFPFLTDSGGGRSTWGAEHFPTARPAPALPTCPGRPSRGRTRRARVGARSPPAALQGAPAPPCGQPSAAPGRWLRLHRRLGSPSPPSFSDAPHLLSRGSGRYCFSPCAPHHPPSLLFPAFQPGRPYPSLSPAGTAPGPGGLPHLLGPFATPPHQVKVGLSTSPSGTQ